MEICPCPQKLFRSEKDRVIAGVAGGLGKYLRIDSNIIRIIFVLLGIFFGLGVLIYLAFWIFVPQESKTDQPEGKTIQDNVKTIGKQTKTVSQEVRPQGVSAGRIWLSLLVVILGVIIIILAGGLGLVDLFGFNSFVLFLIVILLALLVFLTA